MGRGKSSAAINYMNSSDKKFIYITPYLNECDRIIDGCPIKDFKAPKDKPRSKLFNLHILLNKGCNISSTHSLFSSYNQQTIDLIKAGHYTLIMDEVFDIVDSIAISKGDIDDLIENGYMSVDEDTYRVRWLNDSYSGTAFQDLMLRAKAGTLLYYNKTFLFWIFPPEVFKAFDEVIVLTYLFDAQLQRYYFDINGFEYQYIGVRKDDYGQYVFTEEECKDIKMPQLRDKIHILESKKFNSIGDDYYAFSSSWSARYFSSPKNAVKMQRTLFNVLRNTFKGKSSESMWTTFKAHRENINCNGFSRSFVSCFCRATNKYRFRNKLAYCVNIFFNPFLKRYFEEGGCHVDEERYALSEMIQWIWRSAIREGNEIWVYVPSIRMRNLLYTWLDSLS